MTPKLVVDTISPFSDYMEPTHIRVTTPSKAPKEEEARAFFVLVRNTGRKIAEDVVPLVSVSGRPSAFLVMVLPHPGPVMQFEWPGTEDQFDHDKDVLASALVHAEKTRKKSVTLNPRGMGIGFVLLFTIRGRPGIYFPSEAKVAVMFPSDFEIALRFQMRGRGITLAKRYSIHAEAWNSFTVTELELKSRFHHFRKSHEQPQVVFAPLNDSS